MRDDHHVTNHQRRRAVKAIVSSMTALAVYNLLPASWHTPVIESVFLPAHGATSNGASGIELVDPCTVQITAGGQTSATVAVSIDGFVTPPTGNLPTQIQINPVGAGNPLTRTTITAADGTFAATALITGGPGITRLDVTTTVQGAAGAAHCRATPERCSNGPYTAHVNVSQQDRYCASNEFTVNVSGYIAPDPSAVDDGCLALTLTATAQGTSVSTSFPTTPVAPDSITQPITQLTDGSFSETIRFGGSGVNETIMVSVSSDQLSNTATDEVVVFPNFTDCPE